MAQVFALEVNLRTELFAEPLGEIQRRRTAHVIFGVIGEFPLELAIALDFLVGAFQFAQSRHQSLGDVLAAESAEVTVPVGKLVFFEIELSLHYFIRTNADLAFERKTSIL